MPFALPVWNRPLQEWAIAGAVLASGLVIALIVGLVWHRFMSALGRRFGFDPDYSPLRPLRSSAQVLLILISAYYALTGLEKVSGNPRLFDTVNRGFSVLFALWSVGLVFCLFNRTLEWYAERAIQNQPAGSMAYQITLVRKVGNVFVLGIGLLCVLRVAGIDISPLLASGAIGGLAIALAAQDTFSNLFAGYFLIIDRPIRVGDFIRLESGEEGYVQEIGWRNTRILLLPNNLVVIPNSKVNQSIITNYYLPERQMSVSIWCGVSYDSDLERVETVTLEVARAIQRDVEGAVRDWEPILRWREFGDSAVRFLVILRVEEYTAQFAVQSAFIKALHCRFRQEGIIIPFPMRTVVLHAPEGVRLLSAPRATEDGHGESEPRAPVVENMAAQ
ncbi:MAG: mechanosensitive ion channel family protein [Chloroherpetonaceae bacterium]|nr:mechanosensitive ion channel family protein [Chthonomonadaceae bacterium]MDW8206609.1 mechanosensitive ion channel family protein [Chloroherpetonaceae bacterium]